MCHRIGGIIESVKDNKINTADTERRINMGYQESFIYTSKRNTKANHEHIEEILRMFQKYNIRCADDMLASCVCRLYFNEAVGEFKKGMEMLVICGERGPQRSPSLLFDGRPNLTKEEQKIISKIHIDFIESRWDICEAEKTDAITVEKLNLQPEEES